MVGGVNKLLKKEADIDWLISEDLKTGVENLSPLWGEELIPGTESGIK
jgi:hypothetical protein